MVTTATAKRERAKCIRECAAGFSDAVAATLIELADGLEAEADALERAAEKPVDGAPDETRAGIARP